MVSILERSHFFENRLYINQEIKLKRGLNNSEKAEDSIIACSGRELVGFGIRSYSKLLGVLLKWLGYASQIDFEGTRYYVNNSSLAKWAFRMRKLKNENLKLSESEQGRCSQYVLAKRADTLYQRYAKMGYPKGTLQKFKNEIAIHLSYYTDFQTILERVLDFAENFREE